MSNYRRLISYIYAYEGGVKGKNIGFAKLEIRNGQCRIQVNVKKIYVGGNDLGVYLITSSGEILLGKIYIRAGAGEFRITIPSEHIGDEDLSMEECCGLTIHNVEDSWQSYTTIWEDAVSHAAVLELAEVTSANLKPSDKAAEKQAAQAPPKERLNGREEVSGGDAASTLTETVEAEAAGLPAEVLKAEAVDSRAEASKAEAASTRPEVLQAEAVGSPAQTADPQATVSHMEIADPQARTARADSMSPPPMSIYNPQDRVSADNLPPLDGADDLERLQRLEAESYSRQNLWSRIRKARPKIRPFDYENGCEILTINPQDIGLLPREIWNYGNNSFLLHGYYNYRHLILARLVNPDGSYRYLLGVPGHYFNNEKYVASMFGFPNFVLSNSQTCPDDRFGYWYTDISLENQ